MLKDKSWLAAIFFYILIWTVVGIEGLGAVFPAKSSHLIGLSEITLASLVYRQEISRESFVAMVLPREVGNKSL